MKVTLKYYRIMARYSLTIYEYVFFKSGRHCLTICKCKYFLKKNWNQTPLAFHVRCYYKSENKSLVIKENNLGVVKEHYYRKLGYNRSPSAE